MNTMVPPSNKKMRSTVPLGSQRLRGQGVSHTNDGLVSQGVSSSVANSQGVPMDAVLVQTQVLRAVINPGGDMQTFNSQTGRATMENSNQEDTEDRTTDSLSKLSTHSNGRPNQTQWLEDTKKGTPEEQCRVLLDTYIRGSFFNKCKFMNKDKIKRWSNDPNALCLKICNDMYVKKEFHQQFWETHASYINSTLSARRNNVMTLIKKEFYSK